MLVRPSRTNVLTASVAALSLLGDQALYTLLPIYFSEIGLVPIQVGVLLSANRWIRLWTNNFAARLTPHYPAHLLLAGTLALTVLLTLTYALVTSFLVLLIARCLWGLCWSFIRHISVMGVAMDSAPENLGQMMGYFNGISRIGSVVGIVIGGVLFDLLGWAEALVIFAVVTGIGVPLALASGIERVQATAGAWDKSDVRDERVLPLLACGFSLGCVGPGLIMSTLGFVLASRLGTEVNLFGTVLGIATVTGLLLGVRWILDSFGAPIYGAVIDRVGVRQGSRILFVAAVIVLSAIPLSGSFTVLSIGVIVFFVCGTALTTVIAAEASRRGSVIYARYATAGDLGSAFGPIVGWTVFEFLDYPDIAFVIGAILYIGGLVASQRAFKTA